MNHITIHGKITKKAEMKLITINNEAVPVAVFTVVDIGLPYQQVEPVYFTINYPEEAASLIYKYLEKDKEVLILGIVRQKYSKDENGKRIARQYVKATIVELLPVFSSSVKKELQNE